MCNICNEEINQKYLNNQKISHIYLKKNEVGNPVSCYKCSYCNSRLRTRTFKKILHENIHKKESCIINSSPIIERNIISKYLNIEKHIDYHIQRGDPNCETGVDISKPIKTTRKYKYFIASCVFDYILDLKSVFKNISDILEDDGKIIFWISPYRLNNYYFEPKLNGINALSYEKYAVNDNSETGITDCLFSIPWIKETLENMNFELKIYNEQDILSCLNDRWFIASKNTNKIEFLDKFTNLEISREKTRFLDHDNERILLLNGKNIIYESKNFGTTWKTYTLKHRKQLYN